MNFDAAGRQLGQKLPHGGCRRVGARQDDGPTEVLAERAGGDLPVVIVAAAVKPRRDACEREAKVRGDRKGLFICRPRAAENEVIVAGNQQS